MRTELVGSALEMDLGHCVPADEMLHHSGHGNQYANWEYRRELKSRGIECSMSSKAECHDNAVVESFFGIWKQELLHRRSWISRREARHKIHDYIEAFYNRKRRHSHLGNLPTAEYKNYIPPLRWPNPGVHPNGEGLFSKPGTASNRRRKGERRLASSDNSLAFFLFVVESRG